MTDRFQLAPTHRNGMRLMVFLLALIASRVAADSAKISYPPIPTWVQPVDWKAGVNPPRDAKSEGSRYLLYEEQERPKSADSFVRVVLLMENETGVQDSGSLRVSFDPEFQELWWHRVVVHRGSKTIDQLNPAKVRMIQPEPGLNNHMFTGRQTAVLFVEDLRVGDALEYAYTIHGANPILGDHYSTRFIIQSSLAVERERFRVVWEEPTPLQQQVRLTDAPPQIKPWGNGTEYLWDFTNVPAIPYEDYKPATCEVYPYAELSNFADWGSVTRWALPLYAASSTNLPPEMQELIARWHFSAKSDEERARQALQFVQDDLRYTGIELGPDSYQPADPVAMFQKRFGDCKGKVALLRLLLQQMNIEAYPALVNSSVQEAIANRLPSPFAFNHVILKLFLDGKPVWVDPTYSQQGGTLWNRYLPPYGKALVIRPDNNDLEDVPRSRPENSWQQKTTSTFAIKGYELPVEVTVRTEYRGASADDQRTEVASTAADDLAKNYLNYYTRLYPGITGNSPLKISDDRQANVLTIEETYQITNLWEHSAPEKLRKAYFYADSLYHTLSDPNTRIRKHPLALRYPQVRQHEVIVQLPDTDWQIPDLRTNLQNDAFAFSYQRKLQGSTATFNYECRTKLAALPADLVPAYLAQSELMEDLLTDTLQRSDNKSAGGLNWLMVVIGIFGAGFTTIAGIWYWRRAIASPNPAPPILVEDRQLQGLGGWLILIGIGLCLAPLVRIGTLGQSWEGYFSNAVWQTIAMPQGESYHPLYAPLIIFELLGNQMLLGLNLLALWLFFAKRKAFPNLYITFILVNAAFLILDAIGCGLIQSISTKESAGSYRDAARASFHALIWSSYMVKSRRVKATFVK